MKSSATDSLIQRILVGSLAIVVFLLIDYFALVSGFIWVFLAILTFITSMALWEFYEMCYAMGMQPMIRTGIWSAGLYLLFSGIALVYPSMAALPIAALFVLLVTAFSLQMSGSGKHAIVNLAVTFFGFAYIVLPLTCLLLITYHPSHDGRWWLLMLVFVTKMSDIGGFIVGKTCGKHFLAPQISPKKTIEGAVGGLCLSIVTGLVLVWLSPVKMCWIWGIALFGLLGVVAQLGDLAESLLKRDAGIKDSSRLPGLGGVLDIMDSLILTTPLVYLYLSLLT